jgi:NAD(P)-dependent dehydrogenase (short-subunit alcohol dehydrogenase family)
MARALAKCGAKVAVLDINSDGAEAVASQICAQGLVARAFSVDVLDRASLETVAERVRALLGPCDLLINGAGGNHPRGTVGQELLEESDILNKVENTFFDLDPEGIEFVFKLNILGTIFACQVFGRQMVGRPGCCIINISSVNTFRPLTKIPAYSTAKAGVSNFTQWLAVHFARLGIRVNAMAPGFFLTEQTRGLLFHADTGELTARANNVIAHTPMGRFGEPADLIGTMLWLASESASGFVTGAVVPVDGGFSAYSGV